MKNRNHLFSTGGLLMLAATLAWGSSYLFMQTALREISELSLIGWRFGIGFAVSIALLLWREAGQAKFLCVQRYAAPLGFLLGTAFFCVMRGLKTIPTGEAGFLLGATAVFVPLNLMLLHRKRPPVPIVAAAFLALLGLGMLFGGFNSFSWRIGTIWCLLSAYLYSWHIIGSGMAVQRVPAPALAIWQFFYIAIFAALTGFFGQAKPFLPHTSQGWIAVAFLGIICTACGFLCQTEAQKRIDAAQVGVLFTLEPVFALLLGGIILHERLSWNEWSGILLLFSASFLATWRTHLRPNEPHPTEKPTATP